MRIIYTPEGGDRREWDFKPLKMRNDEAELLERCTGWPYQEFGERFMAGSILARRALLYVLLRRTDPKVKFNDVSFAIDEFDTDLDDEERQSAIEALRDRADELTDAQREALEELVAASEAADGGVPDGPKDQA